MREELIEKGYNLALEATRGDRFNTEAFLVMGIAELLGFDAVPESQIDEGIDTSKTLFVRYMRNKSIENLREFMAQSVQIILEVYHDAGPEGKTEILEQLEKLKQL